MSVLTLENINFSYGKTAVLNDVSFDFEKGKMYCITGKSGAGKTTLLSILSRLAAPQSGKISYNGEDIAKIDKKNRGQRPLFFGGDSRTRICDPLHVKQVL